MAEIPVRENGGDHGPSGKRRSRKSSMDETAKPRPKRSRVAPTSSNDADQHDGAQNLDGRSGKLRATVYDAVAGRVGYEGLLLDKGGNPLPPDQVLYNKADAPIRFAENDDYFAHRCLPPDQRLPDSDMLKAIHAYASDFYDSGALGQTRNDFRSLDETALIAMGILIEEAVAASLGSTGDLAFVEDAKHESIP